VRRVEEELFQSFLVCQTLSTSKMAYDPREHFQRIQRNLQSRGGANFGGGAGGPAGRGIVGLVLLAGVVAVGSNALFNGMGCTSQTLNKPANALRSRRWSSSNCVFEDRWCQQPNLL
jgi:hypothetical protein